MTTLTAQSELFVELHDDQAEIVSGGIGPGITYEQLTGTGYLAKLDGVVSMSNVQSGPGGSSVTQVNSALSQDIITGALNGLKITT